MKVTTIGGGPGGLYASLLMKKAHPDWEVSVYESNPPDVTYGWGIVFPNRTLSNLEAADGPSHRAITERITTWEPFDIHYEGVRYRSRGHTFASMLRTDLLSVLQSRCRDLGVDLHFEREIDDPERLRREADLLVAADGINSRTRAAYADAFGTELIEGDTRFSWFGTDADFEALSHIFVADDNGLWCAHTYPGKTSTFIVDCDAETWANARLDEMGDTDYLAYLEALFSDYLDGDELLSQQDRWRRFTTVRNANWHHENVVLVGDAAHTAHYSIGSGTTIAMEDAIGLARAFEGVDDDPKGAGAPTPEAVERALAAYERGRRPFVEALQRSAERSRIHFEDVQRYTSLPAPQFAVHHLTRSGRISLGSLRRRDPDFVDEFTDWFAERAGGEPDDPPSRQPFEFGPLTLPNRLVRALSPTTCGRDGVPDAAHLAAARAHAAGDAGLVLTDPLAVAPDGRRTLGSAGLYDDSHVAAWAGVVDDLHDEGVAVGAYLSHAGTGGARDARPFALGAADREEAWGPRLSRAFGGRPSAFSPPSLSTADRDDLRAAFVRAAERADAVGFDALVLDAGYDSLLASFLSPRTNDRTDAYGGGIDDRLRFPREVVDAVRETWDGPLGLTLQATDRVDGGLTLDESVVVARDLADAVDLVAPVAGGVAGETPDSIHGVGSDSDVVRNEAGVPTLATSYATTADRVETLVGTGRADLCTVFGEIDAWE